MCSEQAMLCIYSDIVLMGLVYCTYGPQTVVRGCHSNLVGVYYVNTSCCVFIR